MKLCNILFFSTAAWAGLLGNRVRAKGLQHRSALAKGTDSCRAENEESKNILPKIAKTAGTIPAALQQEKRRRK